MMHLEMFLMLAFATGTLPASFYFIGRGLDGGHYINEILAILTFALMATLTFSVEGWFL